MKRAAVTAETPTGIPAAGNTRKAAQGIAPESRVMYLDNDDN